MKTYLLILISVIISTFILVVNPPKHVTSNSIQVIEITATQKVEKCMLQEDCRLLTESVYYEAQHEPIEGMIAIMSVINNRTMHTSKRFPATIRGVLTQRCEFSYQCDKSKKKKVNWKDWNRIAVVAYDFQDGKYLGRDDVMFYHAKYLKKKPVFAKDKNKVVSIGNHVFYKCQDQYC